MYTIETLLHDIIGYHYVASQTVTLIRAGGARGSRGTTFYWLSHAALYKISKVLLRFPHPFDRKKFSIGLSSFKLKFTYKTLIQNPGQITRPIINLKMVLKRKLAKNFEKVGTICGNLS